MKNNQCSGCSQYLIWVLCQHPSYSKFDGKYLVSLLIIGELKPDDKSE
ncbi:MULTISPECIES: hypothetical protein [unclassified Pseudoalteromonas]|nr:MULTISPECIES: hypothetical protein [unclassified Pseudoalteromonas]